MMNLIPARSMRAMNPYFPFDDSFFRPIFDNRMPVRMNVSEENDRYLITAELPGVSRDDLKVEIRNGMLSIAVETKSTDESEENGCARRETRFEGMKRSFSLEGIDEAAVTAELKDGLLNVSLPKETESETVRQIEIA